MGKREAQARIKIDTMLRETGWRFFDTRQGRQNIELEEHLKLRTKHQSKDHSKLGDNFENTNNGYADYALLDHRGAYLAVLEAKAEEKNPLDGKEQARKYAQGLGVWFVFLSNGNIHYFWDLQRGNPHLITKFCTQTQLQTMRDNAPTTEAQPLDHPVVAEDYIAGTQMPDLQQQPEYQDPATRTKFIKDKEISILRPYQLKAIHALQQTAKNGSTRFLFEMATGTGKTLISAAVIKLFLKTGNAHRVLFLVDRIELEEQANKNFERYLGKDYRTAIYKKNLGDWRNAHIVVSTIQTLYSNQRYTQFAVNDFDLIIADESHRAIGYNYRAVFEYFMGYKLGLTATPKDYLKSIDPEQLHEQDPRALEKRQLLDTYTTFGCENSEPTFRYSMLDAVKEDYLVKPIALDGRTNITTKLLSAKGYAVIHNKGTASQEETVYHKKEFERKLFSDATNQVFCQIFLERARRDPISKEMGKSIVFCVSQNHASKITQILNERAAGMWPGKYQSDFAMQVTSDIPDSQKYAVNFANNNLSGNNSRLLEGYYTSATRVCVTVDMMTTGYDCPDVLNLVLMRPIYSPTNFIQIKGRGTRKHTFSYINQHRNKITEDKKGFYLFDFFANFKYFEEDFNYDEVLKLPLHGGQIDLPPQYAIRKEATTLHEPDAMQSIAQTEYGEGGMKIDRELYRQKIQDELSPDAKLKAAIENENWSKAEQIMHTRYHNKPKLYLTPQKICKSLGLDRVTSWREILEYIFGVVDKLKNINEKTEEWYQELVLTHHPEHHHIPYIKNYMHSYIMDSNFRNIIQNKKFGRLTTHPTFDLQDLRKLGEEWREKINRYIKDFTDLMSPHQDTDQ